MILNIFFSGKKRILVLKTVEHVMIYTFGIMDSVFCGLVFSKLLAVYWSKYTKKYISVTLFDEILNLNLRRIFLENSKLNLWKCFRNLSVLFFSPRLRNYFFACIHILLCQWNVSFLRKASF